MNGPRLNRHLMLEHRERTPDGAGGFDDTWVSLGAVWADVQARTGRDASGEAVSLSTTVYRIIVRAAPYGAPSRPTPGQRFREGVRVFRIQAVAEADAQARYLTCFCEEEVAL
ncbi:head-tail adaptor protein [Roseovarius rhodophyticola]|uniref:Head-tail adaptor protein n=1 Tax=Roseovarius rhodophyticola TaxID=3080827 RepID=A0ABZ2TF67_9RHOB|nr:head-tail adaptor protein [Roseovarius sp. W115]MDV2928588.1 head-tail adaptor protein [Roseovarius sp. W115]